MNLSHITTLPALYEAIRVFEGCPLKHGATQPVFGDGNPTSGIVLIGEAPGAEEDKHGKPFVGRSGQLLDKLLAGIGLDRTKVFITNTVFWRPPDNRTPTPAEVASCRPFLDRHLALLNPRVVVLVGGTAAKTVLNTDAPMKALRGRWLEVTNPYLSKPIPALATFHPAYLLRNPPAKPEAMGDWGILKVYIKKIS